MITRMEWLRSQSTSQNDPGGAAIVTNLRSSTHTLAAGGDKYKLGRGSRFKEEKIRAQQ